MAFSADDDVVVHDYPDRFGGTPNLSRHIDIGSRWRRIARGVIVHEDNGRRIEFESPFDDLPWIGGHVVNGSAALLLVGDQDVLAVEKKDAKMLDLAMRHCRRAIVDQFRPIRERMSVHHAGARKPMCRCFDKLQLTDHLGIDVPDIG